MIDSTTVRGGLRASCGHWIRQRTRWIKGYMQTALVHARSPRRLVRQVGVRRRAGFAAADRRHPADLPAGARACGSAPPPGTRSASRTACWSSSGAFWTLGLINLIIGNTVAVYLSMLAVYRRHRYELIWWAMLTPIYWVLHSIAAYKALWQLIFKPFYWEKTVHGLTAVPADPEQEAPVAAPIVPEVAR